MRRAQGWIDRRIVVLWENHMSEATEQAMAEGWDSASGMLEFVSFEDREESSQTYGLPS